MDSLPKACLNDLPKEIKMRIVEMSKHQDDAYNSRVFADQRAEERRNEKAGGWYGRSLDALSLVTKELNGLTGKYTFETLSTSQFRASQLETTCAIITTQSHHIRTVEFDLKRSSTSRQTMILALGFISLLPNLQRLVITNDHLLQASLQLAIDSSIQQISPKITQLKLRWLDPADVTQFLQWCPNLSRLEINLELHLLDPERESEESNRLLVLALLRQKKLQHFVIKHQFDTFLPAPWSQLNPSTLPFLDSLSISSNHWNSNHAFHFTKPFAPQLKTLTIRFKTFVAPPPPRATLVSDPPPPPTLLIFRFLRNFTLQGQEGSDTCPLSTLLKDTHFPAVESLTLFYPHAYCETPDSWTTRCFPRSREVHLSDQDEGIPRRPIGASDHRDLTRLRNGRGERVAFTPRYDEFHEDTGMPYINLSRAAVLVERRLRQGYLWQGAVEAVEFARNEVARMRVTGDMVGMRKLMPFLGYLDEMRLLSKD